MKNDPAHQQGEPFGRFARCLCVKSVLSKGNPIIVKILNVFHLDMLPWGEPEPGGKRC